MRVTNLTLAALGTMAMLATLLVTGCASSNEVKVVADEAVLRQSLQRLEGVRDELDQLPNPLGATAGPTELDGCSTDSGAIFQPGVERKWVTGTGGAITGARIVKALRVAGWSVTGPNHRTASLDDPESYELSMQRDGWTAVGDVTAYDDEVFVGVQVKDAEPCHKR